VSTEPAPVGPFTIYRRSPWAERIILRGAEADWIDGVFSAALRPDPDSGPKTVVDVVVTAWVDEPGGMAGDLVITLNLGGDETATLGCVGRGDLKVIPPGLDEPLPVAAWSWTLERDVAYG
jgi:hypothetical protein